MDFDVEKWEVEKIASDLDNSLFGAFSTKTKNKKMFQIKQQNNPKKRKLKNEHRIDDSPVKKSKKDNDKNVITSAMSKSGYDSDDKEKISKKRKKQLKDRQRKLRKKKLRKGIQDENSNVSKVIENFKQNETVNSISEQSNKASLHLHSDMTDEKNRSKRLKKGMVKSAGIKDLNAKENKSRMCKTTSNKYKILVDGVESNSDSTKNRENNKRKQLSGNGFRIDQEKVTPGKKMKDKQLLSDNQENSRSKVKSNIQIENLKDKNEKSVNEQNASGENVKNRKKRKRKKKKAEIQLVPAGEVETKTSDNVKIKKKRKKKKKKIEEHTSFDCEVSEVETKNSENAKIKKKPKKKKKKGEQTISDGEVETKSFEQTLSNTGQSKKFSKHLNDSESKSAKVNKTQVLMEVKNPQGKINEKRKLSFDVKALKSVLFQEVKTPSELHDGKISTPNKTPVGKKVRKSGVEFRLANKMKLKEKKIAFSLKDRMTEQLKAARFRYLNEQLYTQSSQSAYQMFKEDKDAFQVYHDGFQGQVAKWPVNPVDIIIKCIKSGPKNLVVADFGCGDAKISRSVSNKVYSFDLVAVNDHVTVCDMSKVPLKDQSVDVAVFCLSLMGTNLADYLTEAHRLLKKGGMMKVAEVTSRFQTTSVSQFIVRVEQFGFQFIQKDDKNKMFIMMDFRKVKTPKSSAPDLQLDPCLYKKR